MARIGVVIPTCDRPHLLEQALASVEMQTRAPNEVIVVDNGVEPVPEALRRRFAFASFVAIPPRSGASVARNFGAMQVQSDYVAFLDDDDSWASNFIDEMMQRAESDDLDMVASLIRVGTDKIRRPLEPTRKGVVPAWRKPGYGGSNMLVRRQAFWDVGGFSARLTTGEDRALFIEFVLKTKHVGVCDKTYCLVTEHPGERLTGNATLMRGKLDFLAAYGDRMSRRAAREDKFAFLVYLSRAWRFPFWLVGCVIFPDVFIRRLGRKLSGKTDDGNGDDML